MKGEACLYHRCIGSGYNFLSDWSEVLYRPAVCWLSDVVAKYDAGSRSAGLVVLLGDLNFEGFGVRAKWRLHESVHSIR